MQYLCTACEIIHMIFYFLDSSIYHLSNSTFRTYSTKKIPCRIIMLAFLYLLMLKTKLTHRRQDKILVITFLGLSIGLMFSQIFSNFCRPFLATLCLPVSIPALSPGLQCRPRGRCLQARTCSHIHHLILLLFSPPPPAPAPTFAPAFSSSSCSPSWPYQRLGVLPLPSVLPPLAPTERPS